MYNNQTEIGRSMERQRIVTAYIETLQQMRLINDSIAIELNFPNLSISCDEEIHLAFPDVDLIPQNSVDIATLRHHAGEVLEGKFLLCRTIVPANQMGAIHTVVEDPQGELALNVDINNYSNFDKNVTDCDLVLPCGSYLAIKNPWFKFASSLAGGLIIRCDNPSDILLLSHKAVTNMFPDVKWLGSIPNLRQFPNEDFWSTMGGSDRETAEALKKLRNVAFVQKRFPDAIRWYSLALDYSLEDDLQVPIHSNRAAAFLSLGSFHRALEDCEIVMEKKPSHIKGIYRKTKALIGLRKYENADQFIKLKLNTFQELLQSEDLQRLSNSTGLLLKS